MTLLNNVTMHKLAQITLMVLLLAACVVGAAGLTIYGPPQIIVTALILAGACIGTNALLSRLYDVRSDSQSALITALILALVITPTLSLTGLVTAALIGVISQASKYVLAIRGRHVFNPVAIALVIGTIGGLFYPSWWVAAPPLALLTLIAAIIVLYKTRLIRVGLLFITISALIVTLRSVATGAGIGEAIVSSATSWPILFFAGFMLTEPTTLPPRAWQKYAVAALVAVLFAVPFTLGPLQSSPALALVIGNAVAFTFGQKRGTRLTLKRVTALTPTIREFIFTPSYPLAFTPGQYLDLFIPHKNADLKSSRRSFSLTSVSGSDEVALGIRITDNPSSYKAALLALSPGDSVTANTISGDFVLPKDPGTKLLFVAGGIGITPFISQLRSLHKAGEPRDIVLVYFTRSADDVAYRDVLAYATTRVFSDGEIMTHELLTTVVPDVRERIAYVSGPPVMVSAGRSVLKAAGVKSTKTDYFSGY